MEPNPSVFLRAIRRETLSENLLGAGIASGASYVIMQRGAEVLAQLILRNEHVPGMLRERIPQQKDWLRRILKRLERRGIVVPKSLIRAIECASAVDSEPGETDVRTYDLINEGLASGIRALREEPGHSADETEFTSDICQAICLAEVRLREEYSSRLEQLKRNDDAGMRQDLALPAPTAAQIEFYLRARFPGDPASEVHNVQRLVGDNSKDIFFFDIEGSAAINGSYVLRREPAYNVTQASLASEYELIIHLKSAGLPVPRALAGEADPKHLQAGFIMVERLPGATRSPDKLGTNGKQILKEIARISAQIHQIAIPCHLPQFADASQPSRRRMLARVDAMYRRWELERSEGSVIVEAAYHWLRANIDCLDDKSVLTHGDYSLRNILLDGDRISGILDWELCCVSHPAEDLAYIRSWVEPAMPWQEYLDAYRAHSGYDVTSEALWYYSVWVRFWNLVIGAAAYSGYHLNKHRNFVYASVACVEYRESLDCLARLIADSPRR